MVARKIFLIENGVWWTQEVEDAAVMVAVVEHLAVGKRMVVSVVTGGSAGAVETRWRNFVEIGKDIAVASRLQYIVRKCCSCSDELDHHC